MGLLILLGLVAYVVLEWFVASWLAGFIGWTGVFLTVAALVVLGAAVMRRAGFNAFRSLRPVEVDGTTVVPGVTDERVAQVGRDVGDAGMLFVAGLLIAVPGIVTSAVGMLLLVPPIRRGVARGTTRWLRRRAERAGMVVTTRTMTVQGATIQTTVVRDETDPGPDGPRIVRGEIESG
jgi:UPF0716 protein FxsA